MKTNRIYSLVALFILLTVAGTLSALAQVNVNVITRSPMPAELTEWQKDRTLIQVAISNAPGNKGYANAAFSYEVRNALTGERVAHSKDGHAAIPRITIPAGPSNLVRYGPDLINEQSIELNKRYRTLAVATNSLPEGSYEFCLRLLDNNGNAIATTGTTCGRFIVAAPSPATLLQPADNSVLPYSPLPTFMWAPGINIGALQRYRLRIVPIYTGQDKQSAISRNAPVAERTLSATTYQYLPSDPAFINFGSALGFAWQVTSVTATGNAIAKSEVYTFTFGNGTPPFGTLIGDGVGGPGGGGPGGGGPGAGPGAGNNNLGNMGVVTSTCNKARTIRLWITFNTMGFNTFPADILEITGVNPAIADISSDGGTIRIQCKQTGTFTITVKMRALQLGLQPFTNIYTATLTIDCRCGGPAGGGNNGGGNNGGGNNGGGNNGGGNNGGGNNGGGNNGGGNNGGGNADVPKWKQPPCEGGVLMECKWFSNKQTREAQQFASDHERNPGSVKINGVDYYPTSRMTASGWGWQVCLWWCPKKQQDAGNSNGSGAGNGTGSGTGTGSGAGTGSGTGTGTGSGTGTGTGSGTGKVEGDANDCVTTYHFTLCEGETMQAFQPKEPSITDNSNANAAGASIDGNGWIQIEGKSEGETTITIETTTLDRMHEPVRCKLVIKVTVIKCDKGTEQGSRDAGGTDNSDLGSDNSDTKGAASNERTIDGAVGSARGLGTQGGGTTLDGDAKKNANDSLDADGATNNVPGLGPLGDDIIPRDNTGTRAPLPGNGEVTVPIELVQLDLRSTQPIAIGNGDKGFAVDTKGPDCSKIGASRGTAATGGMVIAGGPGSVGAGATVTVTDSKGNTVTTTADDDGSFRITEADLPDGFDHTVGNSVTVTSGGISVTVPIQR